MAKSHRGRPSNTEPVALTKYTISEIKENGEGFEFKYDKEKSPYGPYSCEQFYPKGFRSPKPKIEKRTYGKMVTVMVFKTSNRSNAKTKMKVFNQNIDYVISSPKLPGVPLKAVILDLGVGESMVNRFKKKYNI